VVAVAGWQAWKGWQADQRDKAATRYAAALTLADQGKTKDADAALAQIAGGGDGFAVLAGMRRAALLEGAKDYKGAVQAYEQIATSSAPPLLRDLATLKEGLVALSAPADAGIDSAALEGRIGQLATAGGPWYYQASEEAALFARKKGDTARSLDMLKALVKDNQAPQGVRERAGEVLTAAGIDPASLLAKPDAAAKPETTPAAATPGKDAPK